MIDFQAVASRAAPFLLPSYSSPVIVSPVCALRAVSGLCLSRFVSSLYSRGGVLYTGESGETYRTGLARLGYYRGLGLSCDFTPTMVTSYCAASFYWETW